MQIMLHWSLNRPLSVTKPKYQTHFLVRSISINVLSWKTDWSCIGNLWSHGKGTEEDFDTSLSELDYPMTLSQVDTITTQNQTILPHSVFSGFQKPVKSIWILRRNHLVFTQDISSYSPQVLLFLQQWLKPSKFQETWDTATQVWMRWVLMGKSSQKPHPYGTLQWVFHFKIPITG